VTMSTAHKGKGKKSGQCNDEDLYKSEGRARSLGNLPMVTLIKGGGHDRNGKVWNKKEGKSLDFEADGEKGC